ncbi:MAG: hypothetical protein KGZ68_01110 [Dechloromonas sp.]|nr:hypothetical protein [Dechloromonas sp.]
MARRRKLVTMLVTVSVNPDMCARDARREVRTLVNEQCNYRWDPEDIRVRSVEPVRAEVA